jgi:hypothetical protein
MHQNKLTYQIIKLTMTTETIECCICYEIIGEKNNCVTPCGHKFCFVCLTKALTNNNTCPCCREVLLESSEEDEDDESEWEENSFTDDDDDNSDQEDEEDEYDINVRNTGREMKVEDFTDNTLELYKKMRERGLTKKELMQSVLSYFVVFGNPDLSGELFAQTEEINDKISKILKDSVLELNKELKEKESLNKEQMMFLKEDKERNINALDMIALNYA